mgnify:CR=1 FL=1
MDTTNKESRLVRTLTAFDDANRHDPRTYYDEAGNSIPSELLYAQRMSATLLVFCPSPSEALQLAARSQHIERWKIPRNDYPMDRKGYLRWRSELKKFHGIRVAEIMQQYDYDDKTISRVKALLSKKQMKNDAEVQTLEDVICLVFLRYYFADFTQKHPEEKIISIVTKTWDKMSSKGHKSALALPLSETSRAIIEKALS